MNVSSEPPSPHVRRHGGRVGEEAWSRDTSPPTARQGGGGGGPGAAAAAAAVWADSICMRV